MAALFYYY